MEDRCIFKSKQFDVVYKINNDHNCNLKVSVYLMECRVCSELCTGSTKTNFQARENHHKSFLVTKKYQNKP